MIGAIFARIVHHVKVAVKVEIGIIAMVVQSRNEVEISVVKVAINSRRDGQIIKGKMKTLAVKSMMRMRMKRVSSLLKRSKINVRTIAMKK